MSNSYELAVIFTPEAYADTKLSQVVEDAVKKVKGTITSKDEWGDKSLTYPIKGYDRGVYVIYQLNLEPKGLPKLREQLRLSKALLRSLLVKQEHATVTVEDDTN